MADQPLGARVFVHAEKHHRGAQGGDGAGEGVDGVVIAEHHQGRLARLIGRHPLADELLPGLVRLTLGIQVEVADVVLALEVRLQAGAVALIPQIGLMVAADHQDLGGQQLERE
ncbi:hypothetical protein D3C79_726190 [compost metagenome]